MASYNRSSAGSDSQPVLLLAGRLAALVWAFALTLGLALPATADDWLDNPPDGPERSGITGQSNSFVAQPSVSAAQAAAHVRRLHGGRVLSVSPSRRGDALGYRVRVLVDGGRVKTVYVASGQSNSADLLQDRQDRPQVRTIGDR